MGGCPESFRAQCFALFVLVPIPLLVLFVLFNNGLFSETQLAHCPVCPLSELSAELANFTFRRQYTNHYAPSLFEQGQIFPSGETPLVWLERQYSALRGAKAGNGTSLTQQFASIPADWDGGYGWIFRKYHPSPYELSWRNDVKDLDGLPGTPLCDLRNQKYSKENQVYLDNLPRMTANDGGDRKCPQGKFPTEPMVFDDQVFSKFEYVYNCTFPPCRTPPPVDGPKIGDTKFSYIEPLTGILRHPRACSADIGDILNKNYMIVDPWALVNPSRTTIAPRIKVLYFDGGASLWDSGFGGASQSWFHRTYESVCLNFSGLYMWEMTVHRPEEVFEKIPGYLRPGYRWFNIPLQTAPDHWNNPMNHLLVEAKKEDVVIFKIDFDAPTIEEGLINHILDYPEVAELIDELYFEHHSNYEIMRKYWQTGGTKTYYTNSLKLFSSLRERGVRAHSWV